MTGAGRLGRRALLLLAFLALSGACSTSPPTPPSAAIVIGVDVSLDTADQEAATAVVGAVRSLLESRYHGRVEGVPVSVRVLDDSILGRPDPARGEANLRALVADRRVLGVVGPIQSSVAIGEIPVATAAHLVLVSPTTTSGCLTHAGNDCDGLAARLRGPGPVSYFRLPATDDAVGDAASRFALAGLRVGPVAVGSDGTAYGRGLADGFAGDFKSQGGRIAVRNDFDPHSKADLDGFLQAALAGGANAVFFGGRDAGGACLVRASMTAVLGVEAPFLGGESILTAACLKDAGSATSNLFGLGAGPADAFANASADAAGLLLAAISRAIKANGGNTPTREDVRAQVAHATYEGHWGKFGFDANGDSTLRLYTAWSVTGSPPAWTPLKTIELPPRG